MCHEEPAGTYTPVLCQQEGRGRGGDTSVRAVATAAAEAPSAGPGERGAAVETLSAGPRGRGAAVGPDVAGTAARAPGEAVGFEVIREVTGPEKRAVLSARARERFEVAAAGAGR
ncbi:MAG TPA: hypothetical protein VN520_06330 [Streptomyces sp.]|uniref:hypothetical protein n=1 Tax=Streptomyces sp. TaxID=1931 RepID=UPI002B9145B0|nr:hypothetical protein [Streptomyces sp.]HWU05999.1 hypothetical protein [Streptomyces sp.]